MNPRSTVGFDFNRLTEHDSLMRPNAEGTKLRAPYLALHFRGPVVRVHLSNTESIPEPKAENVIHLPIPPQTDGMELPRALPNLAQDFRTLVTMHLIKTSQARKIDAVSDMHEALFTHLPQHTFRPAQIRDVLDARFTFNPKTLRFTHVETGVSWDSNRDESKQTAVRKFIEFGRTRKEIYLGIPEFIKRIEGMINLSMMTDPVEQESKAG